MSCLFASTDSAKKVLLNPLLSYHIIKYLPLNVLHELPGDNSKLNLCVERVLRNMTTVTCGSQGWPECLHKFDEEDLRGRVSQSLKFYDMSSRVLCHTHNLKVLKLWDIEFYEDMMEALFQHQFMASGTLEHLEIVESDMVKNNRRSNEREETLYRNEKQRLIRKLRSLIVKHCPNLKHLSLTSNSLSDLKTPNSDWNKLVRRLKSLAIHYDPYMKIDMGKNTLPLDLLEVLDFDNCEMEPTCISKLKELTPNLKKLNVGFYGLEDDIFDDCFPKLDHLEELHIYELDDITENERNMASILDKIGKNNGSSLKVLCFTNICLCDIDREMLTPFVKLEEFHHFHRGKYEFEIEHECYFNPYFHALSSLPTMKTIRNDCLDFDELSLEFLIRNGTSIRNFYLENWLHTFESCHEPLIQDFIRLARKYPDEKFLLSFNAHPTKLEQLPKNLTIKYM